MQKRVKMSIFALSNAIKNAPATMREGRDTLTNAPTQEVGTSDFSVVSTPLGLSLWSRFWERLKHLACGRMRNNLDYHPSIR